MGEPTLKDWLNDEETIRDAMAVLKVGIDNGDPPVHAFRLAIASVLTKWMPEDPLKFRSHDERIARTSRLFREFVVNLLPKGEIAVLVVSPSGEKGLVTYISNGEREGCADMLRKLLEKWEGEMR